MDLMRKWLSIVILLTVSSWAGSTNVTCPSGVRPGHFYPNPQSVFQKGEGEDIRCNSDKMAQVLVAQECVPWNVGSEATCEYSSHQHGGYWCPLTPAKDPNCPIFHGEGCLDDIGCFSDYQYGVCRCSQCPCRLEGQVGKDCDLCSNITGGCDTACQTARGFHPGQRLSCDFAADFFEVGGAYNLLFPGNVAQPRIEVDVGPGSYDLRVYYSLCTQKEPLLFSAKFTQCENGIKDACKAAGIPVPCYLCKKGAMYFPNGTFVSGVVKDLLGLVGEGAAMFGCVASGSEMMCQVSFDAFPFDWGSFQCRSGSQCLNENSTMGKVVIDTGLINDFGADENFVLYLILGTMGFFAVIALIIFLAWMYKFKVDNAKLVMTGVHLAWHGISLSDLITDLQGKVEPRSFVAILGPIGAGKSTLLKVLSGRMEPTAGYVTVDGEIASAKLLRQVVGFVPQEDVCCPDDTVAEAIGFANVMSYGKFPEIHAVLRDKLDSRIGTLSGGQRRMTNIYVELARRPKVLILDEPTTGLDSESAHQICQMLKDVSENIPVLATMHQPGQETAGFLNEIFILADGQEVCHAGSYADNKMAVPELKVLVERLRPNVSETNNVLDIAIDLAFEGAKLGSSCSETPKLTVQPASSSTSTTVSSRAKLLRPMPSVPRQLLFISIRGVKRSLRRAHVSYVATFIAALFIGFVYYQVDDELGGVRNRFGAIFMTHAFLALQAVAATSESHAAVKVTEHEIASFVYRRAVDSLVKVFGQMASQLPHAVILSVLVYAMVGLRGDGTRPIIFIICVCACSVGCAFTALVARRRSQQLIGRMRAVAMNGMLLMFCGFLVGGDNVPSLFVAFSALSPLRFSFEMLMSHELIGLRTIFNPKGLPPIKTRGSIYLQQYNMVDVLDEDFYNLGHMLGIMTCVWMLVAFFVLLLPPDACACKAMIFGRKACLPVRVKGHGQLEMLLDWVSEVVLQGAADKPELRSKMTMGLAALAVEVQPKVHPTCNDIQGINNGNNGDNVAPNGPDDQQQTVGHDNDSRKESKQPHIDNAVTGETASRILLQPSTVGRQETSEVDTSNVMEIQWSGLSNKDISNMRGGLRAGGMLGILGPCGSGKTTLLTMLTGRVAPASGSVSIGGKAMSPKQVAAAIGYVPQANCLFPDDTLREALAFAAEVAPSSSSSSPGSTKRTGRLKKELPVTGDQGNQRIGILSGGQQRVTAVAMELVRRPHLLALDEPMSGLDAASSLQLGHLLKRISQVVPVVITLHQPRPELVQLLSHVMVLHQGSLCVSSPLATLRLLTPHSEEGFVVRTSKHATSVDSVLENIEDYRKCPVIEEFIGKSTLQPSTRQKPCLGIAKAVFRRELRRLWHQKPLRSLADIFLWFITGLILGGAYSSMEVDTTKGVLFRAGLMFVISSAVTIVTLPRVFYFSEVRANVVHELQSRVMHPVLYLACHSLAGLTHRLLCLILFCIPIMIAVPIQKDLDSQMTFLSIVICTGITTGFMADAVATWSRDQLSAASIYSGLIIFMLLFGASFVAVDNRQTETETTGLHTQCVSVLMHCSIYLYSFQALMENELTGASFKFKVNGIVTGNVSGEEWLDNLDVPRRLTGNICIIVAFGAFFWMLTALGLLATTWPRRRSAVLT